MMTIFSKGAPALGFITDDNKSVVLYNGHKCVCSKIEASGTEATVYLVEVKGRVDDSAPMFTNNYHVEPVTTYKVALSDVVVVAEEVVEESEGDGSTEEDSGDSTEGG